MDTTPNVGNDLVRLHRAITRALNVSLQYCTGSNLVENDRPGYGLYVRALVILLHAHHRGEDELAFPYWKTRMPAGPFDKLIRQHAEMNGYLEQIEQWIEAGPDAWQANALSKFQSALSALCSLWGKHIALEEGTIGPENSQQFLTPAENDELGKQLAEHGQAHSQPSELVMPFIVYNLRDPDRAEFLKPLPSIMTQQLIPVAWKPAWEPMTPFLLIE